MREGAIKNIIKSLVASVSLTFAIGIVYVLYSSTITGQFGDSQAGTGGIGAVAGGISESILTVLLIAIPVLFLIAFLFLQKRHPRQ